MAINFVKPEELKERINKGFQIVNFYADWCGPCKMLAPILEEVSNEVEVFKINIDIYKEYANSQKIKGIPNTQIYKDGQIIETIVGYTPKEKLLEVIGK